MTTTPCPHPPAAVEPRDLYTRQCRECGAVTTPVHPQAVADEIGPRRPGFVYWDYYWQKRVIVLAVTPYTFSWMPWTITEEDDGDFSLPRTHCTPWDSRNIPLADESGDQAMNTPERAELGAGESASPWAAAERHAPELLDVLVYAGYTRVDGGRKVFHYGHRDTGRYLYLEVSGQAWWIATSATGATLVRPWDLREALAFVTKTDTDAEAGR
ncbi:hypothetical protein [Nocardia wallacei]|uniref:hypothetical protein n=1 Tax=Nocardia wallacei TaxID=480035 RepID=UPI002458E40A|nr:hypothetical protein [Nocardia wallacei]